jgi:3',5'-cyclic AMP phosphodiesterase CpdA
MPVQLMPEFNRRVFLKVTVLGAAVFVFGDALALEGDSGLHLALMSDVHIPADRLPGARGYDACQQLLRAVPDVLSAKPDGLIVTGDLARHEGEVADYEVFLELIEPIKDTMPVYLALGNHDNRDNFYAVVKNLQGSMQPVQDKHVSVIEHRQIRIVLLDSLFYVRQKGGLLGKVQREWLSAYLTGHVDRPVVLMLHHTLGDGDNDLLDTEYFFDLLAPHSHVKAIFHGHSHAWKRYERQGMPIINLPTTAHIRSPEQPIGWVDAVFRRDGMDLSLRAFGGNRNEDGKTFSYAWGISERIPASPSQGAHAR